MERNSGTLSVTLPAICIEAARPPHTYQGVAFAMLPGVRTLATASPLPELPLALVSAHILECTLKAYLSRDGNDQEVKKRGVRHNLIKLWSLAHSDGLNIQSQPPQWVTCLSQLHDSPYYLRYSTGVHGISTPAPEPMVTELFSLVEQVQRLLSS